MTQEEKQLLLKDLCARLPYGVMCTDLRHGDSKITEIDTESGLAYCADFDEYIEIEYYCKPYLRPLSSMTEEEREDWYTQSKVDYDCEFKPEPTLSLENCHLSVDWLNKKGFDYRDLIPMGLALEAPEGMYENF